MLYAVLSRTHREIGEHLADDPDTYGKHAKGLRALQMTIEAQMSVLAGTARDPRPDCITCDGRGEIELRDERDYLITAVCPTCMED